MGLMERCLCVSIITILVLGGIPAGPMAQTPPPANGDWTIYDDTVLSDMVIDLKGNLTVNETGSLTLDNVTLIMNQTSNHRLSIVVDDGGDLTLEGCNITTANDSKTIHFYVMGTMLMNNTTVERLYGWANTGGVSIESTQDVYITNSTIANGIGNAITINHSWVEVLDCRIDNFTRDGIDVDNWGLMTSIISNNTITNTSYGITVNGMGSSYIYDNHIYDCFFAISVQTDLRKSYVHNNNLHDNGRGIMTGFNFMGSVHDNIIIDHPGIGIEISAQSKADVYDNLILDNRIGVTTDWRPELNFYRNTVKNSTMGGMLVQYNSTVNAHNNTFENNTDFAISIIDNGIVDIHNNIISNHPKDAIKVEDNTKAVIGWNSISDTVERAIHLYGRVTANIHNNTIYHATGNSIHMISGPNATIQDNHITSGDRDGIEYLGKLTQEVDLHIIGNTIDLNEGYGVRMLNVVGKNVSIIGNDITRNLDLGLFLSGGASTEFSDNIFENNDGGGIEVMFGEHNFSGNKFSLEKGTAVTLQAVTATFDGLSIDSATPTGTQGIVATDSDLDLEKVNIKWGEVGLDLRSTDAFIRNSTWDSTGTDIKFSGESKVLSYNNTIDDSGFWFDKDAFPSEYRVIWYPDIKVIDAKGRPLSDAEVNISLDNKVVTLDAQGEAMDVLMSGHKITKADGRMDLEHELTVESNSPVVESNSYEGISVTSDAGVNLDFDFAPVLSLPRNLTVIEEEELVIDLVSNTTDPDHDFNDLIIMSSSPNVDIIDGKAHLYYGAEIPGGTEDFSMNITDGMRNNTYQHTVILGPVNDRPVVDIPSVINVTEEIPYELDLEPLIFDEEDDEIIIAVDSDYVQAISYLLTFSYPTGMSGESINISISDGPNILIIPVQVKVIHINLPPMIDSIPPIQALEDIEKVFDLSPFIHDEDDEVLDLIVNFTDTEYVSLDGLLLTLLYPEGVLEDTIMFSVDDGEVTIWTNISVMVIQVDDPPVVDPIPEQKVVPGEAYTIDMSHYISDIDTPVDNLKVTSSSKYVRISGKVVTIKYPEGHTKEKDTITIVVEDYTTRVPVEIDVTIKVSKSTTIVNLEDYSYYLYIIVPLAIVLTAVGFYMYRRLRYEWFDIRDVFLIYDDGRLLAHKGVSMEMDKDIFGGMLTAVQQFVNDSLQGVQTGSLKEFEYEDLRIAIERGEKLYLALFLEGYVTDKVRKRMQSTLDDIDAEYGATLMEWDGDTADLKGIERYLKDLVTIEKDSRSEAKYPDPEEE